jgi:tetratricopeptide (TPR) repeat protein
MLDPTGFFNPDDEFGKILQKFDDMLTSKKSSYFDVEVFAEIISYLIETNQKEKARQALKIGLRQHPNSDELMLKSAQFNIINQDFQKANRILKQLITRDGENAEVYYLFGQLHLASNNLKKAIKYFDAGLTLADFDDKATLLYLITDDLMDKGEYYSAINYLHQILDIDKYDFEAVIDLGTCYKELDLIDRAIEEFNNYLDKDTFNEMIWYQLGMLYEHLNKDKEAIDAYEFAAAIEPEYSSAYFSIAIIYSKNENYEKAIYYLEELIRHEVNNAHAYFYLAESYFQLEQTEKAMVNFEKTIAIEPDFADAWFGIGEIYYKENRIAESLVYIRKAIKHEPGEPLFWLRLGIIQQNLKYLKYAVRSFQKVISLDPYDEQASIHVTECYFELKQYDDVIKYSNKALQKFNTSSLYFLKGSAYIEKGKTEYGLKIIRTGLETDYDAFDNFVYFYPKILSFDAVKKLLNNFQSRK